MYYLYTIEDSSFLAKIRVNNFIVSINLSPASTEFGLRNLSHEVSELSYENKVVDSSHKVKYSELL